LVTAGLGRPGFAFNDRALTTEEAVELQAPGSTPSERASDVTACIPTLDRPNEVRASIERLLSGSVIPTTILVSEALADPAARVAVEKSLATIRAQEGVSIRLLPSPPCGNRSGNRNWLAHHVKTDYLLFMDDDIDLHPRFLEDAVSSLRRGRDAVVVSAGDWMSGRGWLTFRGHFRPATPGDPGAVGLTASIWRTNLFTNLWLDERIDYGYEDAEISVRLLRKQPGTVRQSPYVFRDRKRDATVGLDREERAVLVDRARCYVNLKRMRTRRRIWAFLIVEAMANLVRRRRVVPSGQVPDQWRKVARFLIGGGAPQWLSERRPQVEHLGAAQPTTRT
jgi:hypothetical protein